MKPLVSYICFNRMGSTVQSLLSLLRSKDDFELYIGDNASRDKTWDFLMSLNDPRIKERKRFEHNYGELNVINWALSKRRVGQDFLVMENDCILYDEHFVEHFDRAFREIPNLASACGWMRGLKAVPTGEYFYSDTVMGTFTCTKGSVMDKLGYYSEACYIADVEMNYRIRKLLNLDTGYIKLIDCCVIHPFGSYNCADCKTHQGVCQRSDTIQMLNGETRPADLSRDLYCNWFYPTLNRSFWQKHGTECNQVMSEKIIQERIVYWDSIYSGRPQPEWQEKYHKKFQEFFEEQYLEWLKSKCLEA